MHTRKCLFRAIRVSFAARVKNIKDTHGNESRMLFYFLVFTEINNRNWFHKCTFSCWTQLNLNSYTSILQVVFFRVNLVIMPNLKTLIYSFELVGKQMNYSKLNHRIMHMYKCKFSLPSTHTLTWITYPLRMIVCVCVCVEFVACLVAAFPSNPI